MATINKDNNIRVINFGPDTYEEVNLSDAKDIKNYMGKTPGIWINIEGIEKKKILEDLSPILDIDKNTIHDMLNIHMHPKLHPYENHTFLVSHMMSFDQSQENKYELMHEKISLYFSGEFVLTFHSHNDFELEEIRHAMEKGNKQLLEGGAPYLAYVILDNIVESFNPALDVYSSILEDLEDKIMIKLDSQTVMHIHKLKRELLKLRRTLWYMNQAVKTIGDNPPSYVSQELQSRFRSCYDHSLQYLDIVESYREMCSGLQDLFFSSQGNKMNEIMKVLTVIATIFTPLGFITGFYGMNFYEEEPWWNPVMLNQYWGYIICLGLMLFVSIWLTRKYYKRGWLRGEEAYMPKDFEIQKRKKQIR